jgi:glyoxylase I family protein
MPYGRRQLLRALSFAFGSGFILRQNQFGATAQTAEELKPASPAKDAAGPAIGKGAEMEKVMGLGGLFFRAHDPAVLERWYQQHLGISPTPTSYGETVWQQEAGPTVFSPFPETSAYFGDPHKVWMVNFRVRDLDRMAAQLRSAGIEVKIDPQSYPNGRFARLHDPEGNPIELWEPAVPGASH